jgi:hypothetical protein
MLRGRKWRKYGWGRILDYIGVPWQDPEHWWLNSDIKGQMNIYDYIRNE